MRPVIRPSLGAIYIADAEVDPMCLGVPGQIITISKTEAMVDFWGVQKMVRLDNLTESVRPSDYIIDHAGYAVRRIPAADVADTLALYEVLLTEAGEDPIARDVCVELREEIIGVDGVLV
ncbi:MAG TPA: HypC/HybG/HupF family hydrogenase formation chaperone [Thermoanaerobaculia bacterium]|nr:HypC/HybG/HupF family hydrogenase formation chaperone [Thermoanaerobaculia bacterium]